MDDQGLFQGGRECFHPLPPLGLIPPPPLAIGFPYI